MSSILQSCCHKWWLLGQRPTDLMNVENEWFSPRFCFPNRTEQELIPGVERSLVLQLLPGEVLSELRCVSEL